MRSSLNKLYCTPILKTYYELLNTNGKILTIKKISIKKNLSNKNNNEPKVNKLNSYKYMYSGLSKK